MHCHAMVHKIIQLTTLQGEHVESFAARGVDGEMLLQLSAESNWATWHFDIEIAVMETLRF